jgi:hypothetical protein
MRTSMQPLVDEVRCNGPLADKPVDTSLTPITDNLDFYSRDIVADSGYALIIRETCYALNYSKLDLQTSTETGG